MSRYLRSVRPLLDDKSFQKATEQALEFQNGAGKKFQRYLVLKSWLSSNYVTDWWEEYVYLRCRSPLMVKSNVYGTDCPVVKTASQSARAGNVTNLMLQFRKKIDQQELKPLMVQGMVPLCSWQYERMFNTTRVPGVEADKIFHYDESNHIVVLHKGCYYKVMISENGRLFNACELQLQFENILRRNDSATRAESNLASLTAWNRTKWAQVRAEHLLKGINKLTLLEVESAAFFLSLDDEPYLFSVKSSPAEYGMYAKQLLHGRGNNRWFDKSFTLCVATNGKVSFHMLIIN